MKLYTVCIPNINDVNHYYNITYHITGIFQEEKYLLIRPQPLFHYGCDPK